MHYKFDKHQQLINHDVFTELGANCAHRDEIARWKFCVIEYHITNMNTAVGPVSPPRTQLDESDHRINRRKVNHHANSRPLLMNLRKFQLISNCIKKLPKNYAMKNLQ